MSNAPLKIGQVHALLRDDFPDLELSKIRYYEEMGLVAPQRSRKGYRLYNERDVDCLREAIRLADEEFVPLRVVRLRLIDKGLLDDSGVRVSGAPRAARSQSPSKVSLAAPHRTLTLAVVNDSPDIAPPPIAPAVSLETSLNEFVARTDVDAEVVNRLLSSGVISLHPDGPGDTLGYDDQAIIIAATKLWRSGVDLRIVGSVRRIVEREAGVIEEASVDLRRRVRDDETRRAINDLASEIATLRDAFYRRELRHLLD